MRFGAGGGARVPGWRLVPVPLVGTGRSTRATAPTSASQFHLIKRAVQNVQIRVRIILGFAERRDVHRGIVRADHADAP
eukprot:CAMPEP_0119213366 /NCGR_PEP_ID=MMETSP1327-20130426/6756_1 /TAXON_ID=38833 /ORGANISM="Micromonas pusilla, Strain RCC2306" /LENGTH=78 /DNA_ID=CAMNT_0007210929 /DNA_START=358 /DNA_END=595 /DNA_ORIENTATION=+